MDAKSIMEKAKKKKTKPKENDYLTVYISIETINRFGDAVPKGMRGRVVAEILTEFLDKLEREKK